MKSTTVIQAVSSFSPFLNCFGPGQIQVYFQTHCCIKISIPLGLYVLVAFHLSEIGADLERSVEQLFPMFWLAHVSSPSPASEHAPINRTKTMASSLKWPPTAGV